MTIWLAVIVLVIGIILVFTGKNTRRSRGLSDARTLALDNRTLYSRRHGLAGRPDRIVEGNIPEEWKSSPRVHDSHVAQLVTYFILIEEETGVRPTHGFIVTGDGTSHKVLNTPEIRKWVLEIADKIRVVKHSIHQPIPVNQPASKCNGCGMRDHCQQNKG